MKKVFVISLLGIALLIPSCSCSNMLANSENKEKDYSGAYNPYKILKNNNVGGEIYFDDSERFGDQNGEIKTAIMNIGEDGYTSVEENGTQSDKSFHFYVPTEGLFLLIHRGADFTFYADGFVDTRVLSPGKNEKEHYYYSFNPVKAASLYDKVASYIAEAKAIEEDKRKVAEETALKLASFNMGMVLDLVDQSSTVSFLYLGNPYHNTVDCDLPLDETFLSLIKNANYSSLERNPRAGEQGSVSRNYCVNLSGEIAEKDNWYYQFDEGLQIVTLKRFITDKYDRTSSCTQYYSIDRDTAKAIIDRAIELRNQIVE